MLLIGNFELPIGSSSTALYSSNSEKLEGFTMMLYVPGARYSAFFSLSSSLVKAEKAGNKSSAGSCTEWPSMDGANLAAELAISI